MLKKIAASTLVLATLAGGTLATTGTAEARSGRGGAFAAGLVGGLVGGAVLGSAVRPAYGAGYGYNYGYYAPPPPVYYAPECYFQTERVWDGYGYRLERVRVCD